MFLCTLFGGQGETKKLHAREFPVDLSMLLLLLAVLPSLASAARPRHKPPPLRRAPAPQLRASAGNASSFAASFHSPSAEALWPMPANLSLPPNPLPCTWGPALPNFYVPGCASGGYPCAQFATLAEAQAACAADYACGGVTSQDSGGPPWETRRGPKAVASAQGEQSYVIANGCHGDGGLCMALPESFAIVAAAGSFVDDVLTEAMARYTALIGSGPYGPTAALPPGARTLATVSVDVASSDDTLRFGVDESYSLSVAAGGTAALRAATVWGALRGLETLSQLARHTWTTSAAGAVNASYNELGAVEVADAPRFPVRSLMLDTSRHFMPVSVIRQVMDLMAALKMNALRLHLIDETSWSYFVPALPIVSNTSAFSPLHVYYPADLAALVAYGRARGIVVFPEVDFPSHSQGIFASIPEMGCLTPGPNAYRQYIDPAYPLLWQTMDQLWRGLDAVFPKEYPFHMGGDEVDRNAWATCPSVVAWGAARGIAPADLPAAITDWFYTRNYELLASPPYNRQVWAWEDITDAVNASWAGATSGNLVIVQWNGDPGVWQSDTCAILEASNASVVVAGPFHDVIGAAPAFNSNPEQNYADIYNLTCDVTPRVAQQLAGPELMYWDDSADVSASDLLLWLVSSLPPVAESGWSTQALVAAGVVNPDRFQRSRCRLAKRGMPSHDAYGLTGTFCPGGDFEAPAQWALSAVEAT